MLKTLILMPALALLAACQPKGKPADECWAIGLQSLVGTSVAAATFPADAKTRIYEEGAPLTRDYRLDRLNIEYDKGGTIIRIWCG